MGKKKSVFRYGLQMMVNNMDSCIYDSACLMEGKAQSSIPIGSSSSSSSSFSVHVILHMQGFKS